MALVLKLATLVEKQAAEIESLKRAGGRQRRSPRGRSRRLAIELWRERRAGPPSADFAERARRLKWETTDHLLDRSLFAPDNQRLLDELGRCHDAGSLVQFLDDPSIEPTNNRTERTLRPALIARKVSQCIKTARGSRTFEAWTSVVRSLKTHAGPALLRITHSAAAQTS
jgi:hypothetical protein